MSEPPCILTLEQWDRRYEELRAAGLEEPRYGGPLRRHVEDGDSRLCRLTFDSSPAALRLWNFLLSEEDRLAQAREEGKLLVGAMKDLGTVPVMAFSDPGLVAFYPDGAWWIPCVMELGAGLFSVADSLGLDDSFCPVRAMIGAFVTEAHFPIPDLLISSAGAICDDLSAVAQRIEGLGHPITWWEIPARRTPDPGEEAVRLPGGFEAPASQVAFVRSELERLRAVLQEHSGRSFDEAVLSAGIDSANQVRERLDELRRLAYTADPCPLPALEMLIVEMLALHFCSDREECLVVIEELLVEVRARVEARTGVHPPGAVRVFWVNPVADLRAMNLLESCGARICGTELLFSHALDLIPRDLSPMEALARTALADPMVGPAADRAERVCRDIRLFGSEAVIISRIPGASHCATEGEVIRRVVDSELDIPVLEVEIPSLTDTLEASLLTRFEALVETVHQRRRA